MQLKIIEITRLRVWIVLSACAVFFVACSTDAEKKPDEKQKYVIPDSILNTLLIDTVQKCQLVNAITLTGQVDFNQDHIVKIFPLISGNIQGINVVLGDYVKQGQVLGVVKSSEMAGYSNDLVNAESNLRVASKNLDKTKDMFKSGLASLTDSLSAEVAFQQILVSKVFPNSRKTVAFPLSVSKGCRLSVATHFCPRTRSVPPSR